MKLREKLVELIGVYFGVDPAYFGVDAYALADHLMANGVTVQEWIPVTEKLPEVGVRVIVCRDEGKVEQGIFLGASGFWKVFGANTKKVTHWQHLPEPPKGGLI